MFQRRTPPEALAGIPPRFRVGARLGAGAMGAVYRAEDQELGRAVALKVLTLEPREDLRARFEREAQALAALRHPHIVQVFDYGVAEAGPYLVMELLEGGPLLPLPRGERPLEVLLPVAEALQRVHDAGLLHRDVKPGNMLRARDGRAVLLDFGLVQDLERTRLTRTGLFVGTPLFASPECLQGAEPGPGTDWWGWACTLFQACEGRLPFTEAQLQEVLEGGALPAPRLARVAPGSPEGRYLQAALGPFPEERPGDLEEVRALLAPQPAGPRATVEVPVADSVGSGAAGPELPPTGRRAPWVALAAGVVLLALGAARWRPAPPPPPARPGPAAPNPARALAEASRLRACATPGETEGCLDPDPVAWPAARARLEEAAALDRWLAAGGRPEDLAPAARAGLAAAAAALESRGWPGVYRPFLAPPPEAGPAPTPPPPRLEEALEDAELPGPYPPWTRGALQAVAAALEARRALDPGDFLAAYTRNELLGVIPGSRDVARNLRVSTERAAYRARVRRHLAPGEAALRRALGCLARAAAAEPEAQVLQLELVGVFSKELWIFLYGPAGYEEVEQLLGGRPPGAVGAYLRAELLRRQDVVRRAAGARRPEDRGAALEAWEELLGASMSGAHAASFRRQALARLLDLVLEARDYPRLARLWEAWHESYLGAAAPGEEELLANFVQGFSRPACPLPARPGLRRLLDLVDGLSPEQRADWELPAATLERFRARVEGS